MLLSMTNLGNLDHVFSLTMIYLESLVMKNMVEYPTNDWAYHQSILKSYKLSQTIIVKHS